MSRRERILKERKEKSERKKERELRRKDSRLTNRLINRRPSFSRRGSFIRDDVGNNFANDDRKRNEGEFQITRFRAGRGRNLGHVTAISKNRDESMLLIGNTDGMIASYGLGNGEPLLSNDMEYLGNKPVQKIIIFDHQAAVHNGGLHLWDMDKGQFVTHMSSEKSGVHFTDIAGWEYAPKRAIASTSAGTLACIDFRGKRSNICYEWNVSISQRNDVVLKCIDIYKEHYILVGTGNNKVYTLDQRTGRILNRFHGGKYGVQQIFAHSRNFTLANKDPNLHILPGANNLLYGFSNGRFSSTWINADFNKQKCVFMDSSNFIFNDKIDATSVIDAVLSNDEKQQQQLLQSSRGRTFSHNIVCSSFLPLSRVVLAGNSAGLWSIKI